MSYYMTATLEVDPPIPTIDQEEYPLNRFGYALSTKGWLGEMYDSWVMWEEELRELSLKYPDNLFTFEARDENDNAWISYFKGGKHQMCNAEITYPPYDPEKLT